MRCLAAVMGKSGFEAGWIICQVIAVYALRLNSRAGTECWMVSSFNCDRWLILGLEALRH